MKAMITDKQARLFARTILPDLYKLQERKENRDKPKGGIYHLRRIDEYSCIIKESRCSYATAPNLHYLIFNFWN